MADKTPTDPITVIVEAINKSLKKINDGQHALQADQKILSENQKLLLERFPDEIGPLYDQLIQVTERLDQIERTIYDDAWERRTEAK